MSTSLDYIEFVCDQIAGSGVIRYRKMFGEYMVYVNDKPILLVCENIVYVKKIAALKEKMFNAESGIPYKGAKGHYVLDIDNAEFSKDVIDILEPITPVPKKRKKSERDMESLNKIIYQYGKQVEQGDIRRAYRGIMTFIKKLRIHFKDNYPKYYVSGNIYQGYMDMTFFSLSPQSLKVRELKVAIVFVHEKVQFEIWLTGRNNDIQTEFRERLRKRDTNKYFISADEKGVSSIIESLLVDKPDFDNRAALTNQIEVGVINFIKDIENLLN